MSLYSRRIQPKEPLQKIKIAFTTYDANISRANIFGYIQAVVRNTPRVSQKKV